MTQMLLFDTRMPLGCILGEEEAQGDSERGRGILVQKKAICPGCGSSLRVESYTSQRPGQEPEVRAVGICTGQGVTRKSDGVRWRPRAGCGRFVLG